VTGHDSPTARCDEQPQPRAMPKVAKPTLNMEPEQPHANKRKPRSNVDHVRCRVALWPRPEAGTQLLGFSLPPRVVQHLPRRRTTAAAARDPATLRDRFIHAKYRFVLSPTGDYTAREPRLTTVTIL
jgi:hypothetical protein